MYDAGTKGQMAPSVRDRLET
jgi:hypothetical protein